MTSTGLRPPRPTATGTGSVAARRGPFTRIVVASVLTGPVGAAVAVLGIVPGAPEHTTTAAALLALAAGWTLLALLTTRMTSAPQRWAYALAAFLGASALALLILAPGDGGLTAVAWAWPPALLGLLVWSVHRMRGAAGGRGHWLLYPLMAVLGLSAAGALGENVAAQRDESEMAMPGRLYDVGGYRLHLDCVGTGSPTVVLESGLGGNSRLWARIADGAATTTRVCAYDRAGTGWSDDAPDARDSLSIVNDLHQLLSAADERAPYVLVGHSTGGVYAVTYAAQHPEQVAGMVLLDSASPRQFSVLPDYADQYPVMTRLYAVRPVLQRLGLGRILPGLFANDVPGQAGKQAQILSMRPRDGGASRAELATYRRSFAQAQSLTDLEAKPLVVLSASDSMTGTAGWPVAQQQLAALSSNSSRRDVESTHVGLLEHPVSSIHSIGAIRDVVLAVRSDGPVSP